MSALDDLKKVLAEAASLQKKSIETIITEEALIIPTAVNEEESIAQKTARYLNTNNDRIPAKPENIEQQRWNDPLVPLDQKFVTIKDMNDHYSLFLNRIQKQMSTMGGSGEVNFRYLDDVNRFTMASENDNHILEYDAASGKVQFTNQIGPIDFLKFDLNHAHEEERIPGTLCWDSEDQTLNLTHPGGVTQQIGQELYAKVRNNTGALIEDGTVVRFDGASMNGSARIEVAPFIADGTFPSLYGLGIATQDIENGTDGKITVWGKIRELDTTGGNENWQIGDILYVSPTSAGGLTNVKPTAPNNVIPIAAVLRVDTTEGEIFVRPTIEQQKYYGRFAKKEDQIADVINTAYPIEFNETEISNGVTIGTPASRITVIQSGFYQFDVSIQVTATSNKGIVYLWYRKNGVDIPYSSRRTTITNGDTFTLSTSLQISLDDNDYVELVWAASSAGILLDANPLPSVGPAVASVLLSVGQIQL